jgi:predicted alpha/beta hydrolase family esterase
VPSTLLRLRLTSHLHRANRTKLVVLAAMVAVGLLSGCGGEDAARQGTPDQDRRQAKLPQRGRYIDMGAYRLFMRCAGSGSPTVVFEAGAGLDSSDWQLVQPRAARITRVCSYDRRGLGRSGASADVGRGEAPSPSDQAEGGIVERLQLMLANAGVEPPVVLVGHSMGGLYVREYVSRYPRQVAAMVLVDSVSGGERPLGHIPLVVLTAADAAKTEQARLARLSSNSIQVIAKRSGHFIEQDQPALVTHAVREVVEAVRRRADLRPCDEAFRAFGGECVAGDLTRTRPDPGDLAR